MKSGLRACVSLPGLAQGCECGPGLRHPPLVLFEPVLPGQALLGLPGRSPTVPRVQPLLLHLLAPHWTKQATWPSPASVAERKHSCGREGRGPLTLGQFSTSVKCPGFSTLTVAWAPAFDFICTDTPWALLPDTVNWLMPLGRPLPPSAVALPMPCVIPQPHQSTRSGHLSTRASCIRRGQGNLMKMQGVGENHFMEIN